MSKEQLLEQKIGACVVVTRNQGAEVLLGKRLNSYKSGWFGIPGGRLEVGEPLESCAKRELQEEVGIIPKSLKLLGVIRDFQGTYDFIHFAYMCHEFEGNITVMEPDKCAGWEWYKVSELPENILEGHRSAIELQIKNNSSKDANFIVDNANSSK